MTDMTTQIIDLGYEQKIWNNNVDKNILQVAFLSSSGKVFYVLKDNQPICFAVLIDTSERHSLLINYVCFQGATNTVYPLECIRNNTLLCNQIKDYADKTKKTVIVLDKKKSLNKVNLAANKFTEKESGLWYYNPKMCAN